MSSLPEILELLVQQHTSNLDHDFPQSLSPFLKTNDLPPESDVKVLGDISKHVSDALRLITSDMESLISAHSQLKRIQDHLLRVDAEIKRAMPPIERLPVEILMQVFKEATSEMGDALDIRWEPFVISRVCHKWRVVATEQCPEIWSEFVLEWAIWDNLKEPVSLFSLVLSRGVERSLEFNFEASVGNDVSDRESEKNSEEDSSDEEEEEEEIYARRPSYYRRDDGITERLLQDLVSHCHRWRGAYFSIPARLFHLLSPIRGKLPALVLFSLDCVADDLAVRSSILTESYILDGAPLLEDVSVYCLGTDFPVLIPQGVPNLISYMDYRSRVEGLMLHQHFLKIVRTSPHLKSFSVMHSSPFTATVPTPRIVHPGITWLSAADGTFLRSLTLPGLKNVNLYNSALRSRDIHREISSLYDLVVRSACNLSFLRVVNCAVNENLIHILDASTDLTSLTLQIPVWDGDSAQTLKCLFDRLRSSEHVLVPRLQRLTLLLKAADFLGIYSDSGLFGPPFGYFIEDRWRKGTLRSVTVTIRRGTAGFTLSQGCREKLIRLKDEGMNIEFSRSGTSLL
ncbi:uncharacterized protein ARMOST_18945 [Armillaria ostoyae]|uniref:Uncharacterized protein n=1 Tax=Armillaria ostoyae TaxID=47428 RepID=A0A284S3A4_ARMOS|nr:uncharacterized protein ARMOST_18945 [Armillaria ostoyae]